MRNKIFVILLFISLLILAIIFASEPVKLTASITNTVDYDITDRIYWNIKERGSENFVDYGSYCQEGNTITISAKEAKRVYCTSDKLPSNNTGPHLVNVSFYGRTYSFTYGETEKCSDAGGKCKLFCNSSEEPFEESLDCLILHKCCVAKGNPVEKPDIIAHIDSPKDGETYDQTKPIAFAGSGVRGDTELTDLTWESSVDGFLGNEPLFEKSLSFGRHRITLAVKDGTGKQATDAVTINVGSTTPSTYCNSCSDCSSKIQSASPGDTVYLTEDIDHVTKTCINFGGADNIIFDCQSNSIKGKNDGNHGFGIHLRKSNNNIIRNCGIFSFVRGILFEGSSNNIITGNTINFNKLYGIEISTIYGPSSNNIITDNIVSFNEEGIMSYGANKNSIIGNTLSNNKFGINLYGACNNNSISENILCSNKLSDFKLFRLTGSGNNGNGNICNKPGGWNDSETTGCSHDCSVIQPPIISNVKVEDITFHSARIIWETDKPSDSIVNYGSTTAVENIVINSFSTTRHSISLTRLEIGTTYYFEVSSTDSVLNTIDNNGGIYYNFTTSTEKENISSYDIMTTATAVKEDGSVYDFNTWASSSVYVTLTCDDETGQGCDITYYCIDTDNTCDPTIIYDSPIQIKEPLIHYIRYKSIDIAGVEEPIQNQKIKLTILPLGMCWSKEFKYISQEGDRELENARYKLCKCITGVYGYSDTEMTPCSNCFAHTDIRDNENWEVKKVLCGGLCIYKVRCSDWKYYEVAEDYFYTLPDASEPDLFIKHIKFFDDGKEIEIFGSGNEVIIPPDREKALTVKVTIKNNGRNCIFPDSSREALTLYIDGSPYSILSYADLHGISDISTGESRTYEFKDKWIPPHTIISLKVKVDVSNEINEFNEDNNEKTIKKIIQLPEEFDWRNHNGENWMTDVKNQGDCDSCWAFAELGMMEAVYKIEQGNATWDPNLSEEYLIACDGGGNCCGGGNYYKLRKGVVDEDCFRYKDKGCSCPPDDLGALHCKCTYTSPCSNCKCSDKCDDWESRLWKIISVHYVDIMQTINYKDITMLKYNLIEKGPLAVTIFDTHEVVLVGYTPSSWIIKNSWGPLWGINGNGYGTISHSGLSWGFIYVEGIKKP